MWWIVGFWAFIVALAVVGCFFECDCLHCRGVVVSTLPTCSGCGHQFAEGEPAWARDVKVIDPDGVRTITRYTCDTCDEAKA
jgi:hypothetical protein